ncbi:glycosyltransferase [Amycolatopsis sp. H20-H5]|uniref:glycosyltransferase n=1 Tax=Amycolatopsis sp. H20-H5 TaxID=3046309 RepID=UPI002DBC5049|nr:glycosyltransferase [Amycolatopsis sp. H20-H5]MEC3977319.1 glycosyltransferase [Amycolatopsis sp. H20-H5]
MRVLHVISEMGTGGAEALVAGMVAHGEDVGWESAVASSGGFRADALLTQGFATFDVPRAGRSKAGVVRAALATGRAVRRFRPDLVLAHNVGASAVAKLALLPGRARPLVTVFHGVAEADYPGAARILRRTSDSVVAVSPATAERLREAGLRTPAPVVVRNAVFPQPSSVDREIVRAKLGVTSGVPVALCLARMEPQKRHDLLLTAWAALDAEAVLWLAGDGSLREDLERRSDALGLGHRVRFLGNRADGPDLLAAADVTVLTSDWEGLPLAVLESLAAGRPVVATDVGGVAEALAGGGGLVVPRGDREAITEALRHFLFDPAARDEAAAAVREHDPGTLMKSYDELLRTALTGRRR